MQDSFDLTTIIFLALAVFVIWRLRSVLGTRTGTERPPAEFARRAETQAPAAANDANVVRLPEKPGDALPPRPADDPDRWKAAPQAPGPRP